jgi:hypothetical protein
MKLSQFKVNKTLRFGNGVTEVLENEINGEVQFYNLTYDVIEKLNNEVIQKLDGSETDNVFVYKVLPFICNVEVDLTQDEFLNLCKVPGSSEFTFFLEAIIDVVNSLFDSTERLSVLQEKAEVMNNKLPEFQSRVNVETPQQEFDRLMGELPKVNDKQERIKMFARMNELQQLLGE